MIFLFENFAESRLEAGASSTDLVLVIPAQDSVKFPKPTSAEHRFALVLFDGIQDPEICWASANPLTGNLSVERGTEGTGAKTWRAGTAVINAPTKVSLDYLASGGSDSWHQELLLMIEEAYARITTETQLRIDGDGALASRIDTVETGLGDTNAAVNTIAQAFSGISTAWAQYQIDVSAQTSDAVSKATQALNTSVENGQATAELKTFVETAVGDNAAVFAEKIQAFTDFDEAQVQINTDVESRVGTAEANLSNEILLRTSQYDAQAIVNQTQAAQIGANTADILTETTTRAGETSALASRSTALESEVGAARGGQGDLKSRIDLVESTAASDTGALATRTSTLEAQMGGTVASGIKALVTTEESARVAADSALASRSSTLEAQMGGTAGSGLQTQISSVETASVSRDAALGTRTTTLESKNISYPNLLRNSDGSLGLRYHQFTGVWALAYDAAYGSIITALGGADYSYWVSSRINAYQNTAYTVSWEGDGGTHPDSVLHYVTFFRADGSVISDGQHVTDFTGVSWSVRKSFSFVTPPDTASFQVVCRKAGTNTVPAFNAFFSRMMVTVGTVAVNWTDAASTRDTAARVSTEELTRADQFGSLASRTDTVEATANAAANPAPNLVPNSTGLSGVQGWNYAYGESISADSTASDGSRFIWFPSAAGGLDAARQTDPIPYGPGLSTSLSAEVFAGRLTSGAVRVYISYHDAADAVLGYLVAEAYGDTNGWIKIKRDGQNSPVSPAGTHHIRVAMDTYAAQWVLPNPVVAWRKIKVEDGPKATPWNDLANTRVESAKVTQVSQAVANAGNLDAWWEVITVAGSALAGIKARANSVGGSQLAMVADAVALYNTVLGVAEEVLKAESGNVFIKKNLYLGDWRIIMEPAYPAITIRNGVSRVIIGPDFGEAGNNFCFWMGRDGVPVTVANAAFALGTDGNIYRGYGTLNINTPDLIDLAVTGAKIGDLQVDTIKIANYAVTDSLVAFTSGSVNIGSTSPGRTTLQTQALTVLSGERVDINASAVFRVTYGGSNKSFQLRILRNGVVVFDTLVQQFLAAGGIRSTGGLFFSEIPGAGTFTYTLEEYHGTDNNSTSGTIDSRYMKIERVKR